MSALSISTATTSLAAAAREGSSAVRLQCRYTLQEGKLTPYLSYATVKEG